jgi:hypothetical protein
MTMTTETTTHDSATCTLGADGGHCEMCVWATSLITNAINEHDAERRLVEQSTTAIHARRRALLQRATPDAPTDGAVALAHAYLADETWFQRLPDNAAEDVAIQDLAQRIDSTVSEWIMVKRRLDEREQRRLREDG